MGRKPSISLAAGAVVAVVGCQLDPPDLTGNGDPPAEQGDPTGSNPGDDAGTVGDDSPTPGDGDPVGDLGDPFPSGSGLTQEGINACGVARTYWIYVPPTVPAADPTVLISFHGGGGSGAGIAAKTQFEVSWPDAVVVYPDGISDNWHVPDGIGVQPGPDDLCFVDQLWGRLVQRYGATGAHLHGHSRGGMMAYWTACERNWVIALAPTSTSLTILCTPAPVPLYHIHGQLDDRVAWGGGGATHDWPDPADGISLFAQANGCDPLPVAVGPSPTTQQETLYQYQGCNRPTQYLLHTAGVAVIPGSGHKYRAWMTPEILAFFDALP